MSRLNKTRIGYHQVLPTTMHDKSYFQLTIRHHAFNYAFNNAFNMRPTVFMLTIYGLFTTKLFEAVTGIRVSDVSCV